MENLDEQLQDLFRTVFDEPSLTLNDSMTADDIDGWDSMMHINLIIAIEKHCCQVRDGRDFRAQGERPKRRNDEATRDTQDQ